MKIVMERRPGTGNAFSTAVSTLVSRQPSRTYVVFPKPNRAFQLSLIAEKLQAGSVALSECLGKLLEKTLSRCIY